MSMDKHELHLLGLRWLHTIDDLRLPEIDQKKTILEQLETAYEANGSDDAWVCRLLDREPWVTHALGRLHASADQFSRSLGELLGELADEAAAFGGWSVIAQHALDARTDLEPEVRELVTQTLRDIAKAGAESHARVRAILELLAQQGDTRP
jgi:hypothetical protein